jgi:hypothetical protein
MSKRTLRGTAAGLLLLAGAGLTFPVQAADAPIPLFGSASNVGWVAQAAAPGAFTAPWSAIQRYRGVEGAPIGESFCAEGTFKDFNLDVEAIPRADKLDF